MAAVSRSNCVLDGLGRNVEGLRINIDKDGFGSDASDGTSGSEERKWSGDDLVARTDFKSQESENQGVRPGSTSNGISAPGEGADFVFKRSDFRPENELLGFQSAHDRIENFLTDGGKLRLQIEERHQHFLRRG